MKHSNHPLKRKGFTLVELLVVITIIAILAAMSFVGLNAAIRKSKETQSKAIAVAVAASVERFYNDYNKLPDLELGPPSGKETEVGSDAMVLVNILLAQEDPAVENKRKINYLKDLKETKKSLKNNGVYYGPGGNSDTAQGLYDAFGNPFEVIINVDYEDALEFTYGGESFKLRNKNVAVMSPGADKVEGTKDDILSFE